MDHMPFVNLLADISAPFVTKDDLPADPVPLTDRWRRFCSGHCRPCKRKKAEADKARRAAMTPEQRKATDKRRSERRAAKKER